MFNINTLIKQSYGPAINLPGPACIIMPQKALEYSKGSHALITYIMVIIQSRGSNPNHASW